MVGMLWLISAPIIGFLALRWYIRRTKTCPSHMRLDDHTIVITGASSGIGRATAFELARRGGRLILACRDRAKTEPVVKQIQKETGNRNVEFKQLDLASQRSIREFAKDFAENEHRLDILINNAAYEGPKCETEDGIEKTLGVNHIGHFLLTQLLLPKLRTSSPSRVVVVASDIYSTGRLDLDNLEVDGYPEIHKAYARSKLANVYFTTELNRRFSKDGVTSYAVHPGIVSTDLFRNFPGVVGLLLRNVGKLMFKSAEQGCQTVVFCAVARGIEKYSGKYFCECHTRELSHCVIDALNSGEGEKLWEISEKLCRTTSSTDISDADNLATTEEQNNVGNNEADNGKEAANNDVSEPSTETEPVDVDACESGIQENANSPANVVSEDNEVESERQFSNDCDFVTETSDKTEIDPVEANDIEPSHNGQADVPDEEVNDEEVNFNTFDKDVNIGFTGDSNVQTSEIFKTEL